MSFVVWKSPRLNRRNPADVPFYLESLLSTRSICTKADPWLSDNRGPEIVATITILTLLGTIAVVLRCLARRISNLSFGADDWLIGLAMVRMIMNISVFDFLTISVAVVMGAYHNSILWYVIQTRLSEIEPSAEEELMIVAVHNGFGKHILMLESDQFVPFTKVRLVRECCTLPRPDQGRLLSRTYISVGSPFTSIS